MNDRKNQGKVVTFKPEFLSSSTFGSENVLDEPSPTAKVGSHTDDDLKNILSSVWTFNAEFINYPAISFDQEGSMSWGQIIKENILQPFLPKNRLILQHIVKELKDEQQQQQQQQQHQKKPGQQQEGEKSIKLGALKSRVLTGNAANVDIKHLEHVLNEIRKKMDRKSPVPKKMPTSQIFETRSRKSVNNYLKKKDNLEARQNQASLVNHHLFDLNLSLRESAKELDYFQIYVEPEDHGHEKVKLKKSFEHHHIKTTPNSAVNTPSPKTDGIGLHSPGNLHEQVFAKRMVRRKSCCCSICGGTSAFEKRTIDLVLYKEEVVEAVLPPSVEKHHHHSQPEAVLLFKDKFGKVNRLSKDSTSTNFSKATKEKDGCHVAHEAQSSTIRNVKTFLEGAASSERRKSTNTDQSAQKIHRATKNKMSIFTKTISPTRIFENNNHPKTTRDQLTLPVQTSLAIPTQENAFDVSIDVPLETGRGTTPKVSLRKPKSKENFIIKENGVSLKKTEKSLQVQIPSSSVYSVKRTQSTESMKEENIRPVTVESTRGLKSLTDRHLFSNHISQPLSTKHRLNFVKSSSLVANGKAEDLFKEQLTSPGTASSSKKAMSAGLRNRRKITLLLNSNNNSPKSFNQWMPSASPKTARSKKSGSKKEIMSARNLKPDFSNNKEEITKVYKSYVKSIPIPMTQLQLQQISSPLLSGLLTLRRGGASVATTSKVSLDLTPYRSPSANNLKGRVRINKPKAMSVSIQNSLRTPTCP